MKWLYLIPFLATALPAIADPVDHEAMMTDMVNTLRLEVAPVSKGPVPNAFVAAEDRQYFGATLLRSTITRYVARTFKSQRRNHKMVELAYAARLNEELSHAQVLSGYLNRVYLGNKCFGVTAASIAFFGKPVEALNVREAAILAALPKAPRVFMRKQGMWMKQANFVVDQMLSAGLITAVEAEVATLNAVSELPLPDKCGD